MPVVVMEAVGVCVGVPCLCVVVVSGAVMEEEEGALGPGEAVVGREEGREEGRRGERGREGLRLEDRSC